MPGAYTRRRDEREGRSEAAHLVPSSPGAEAVRPSIRTEVADLSESTGAKPPQANGSPQGDAAQRAAAAAEPNEAPSSLAEGLPHPPDPLSSMTERFNFVFRWFARRYFDHFELDEKTVEHLRDLERKGSVIYVMRYSSRLDYFLFNTLFARQGLRLSAFANGLSFYYYRPFWEALRITLFRKRGLPREIRHADEQSQVRGLVRSGRSIFLFMRTARLRGFLRGRRADRRQDELDLLEQVVRDRWESDDEISVVPLALFWRKGPRSESRFLNLSYGSLTRPSDLAKVTSFMATYRDLSVKVGEPVDLRAFIRERHAEGPGMVARKVRRSILIHLYAEEKVVEGPTVRPPGRVWLEIQRDAGVRAAVELHAKEKRRGSLERAEIDAERMFREIAANMNSTFLAVLGWIVGWMMRRMFNGVEIDGLEQVADKARQHPLVLVPNHRSYFDFLILSWLFYQNFLVPPHIVARDNMAFGPFGFIFRRAGAFFMRRSFDDPLYKEVFRAYVAYLVREGFTQEFFIEGGRSRTGKMLPPRFGVLSWDIEAFLHSPRRDLFFVPIGITYERLVEESAMIDELEGGEKQKESVAGLVRARRFLRSRFGTVHIRFSEPISMSSELGDRRERFRRGSGDPVIAAEQRAFVEELGYQLTAHINDAVVVNATSVAATILLGAQHRGLLRPELLKRMRWLTDLLRADGAHFTAQLESGELAEPIDFLDQAGLVQLAEDPRGPIVHYPPNRRRALDIYRNAIVHRLAVAAFALRAQREGVEMPEIVEEVRGWLEVFQREYFVDRGEPLALEIASVLSRFEARGWLGEHPPEDARRFLDGLIEQVRGPLEAYTAMAHTVGESEADAPLMSKELKKRAAEVFQRSEWLGEARCPEAANPTTFDNALAWLCDCGVLVRTREGEGDYARGDAWESLPVWTGRLAAELADG